MIHETKDGRIFTEIGLEPYVTRDGRTVALIVWEACCAHVGCQERFTVKVSLANRTTKSAAFGLKHCAKHRLSKAEVQQRRLTAIQRVTKAEVAEIRRLAKAGHKPEALALVYPVAERTIKNYIWGRRR